MILKTFNVFVCIFTFTLVNAYDYDFDPSELAPIDDYVFDHQYLYDESFPHPTVFDKIGQVSGVSAVNRSHVYVFHRADRKWEGDSFDASNVFTKQDLGPIKLPTIALLIDGKLAKQFGEGLFFMPHSITVDGNGNIWTSDVALHQVFKFNENDLTKPELILGERFKPGNDAKHFCKPTDVKVAQNGDFFVSDGYCNSRVMKFKPDGSLITYWAHTKNSPGKAGKYELDLPHSLALLEEANTVFVADRQDKRVVAYSAGIDTEDCGQFLNEVSLPERVYAIDVNAATNEIYTLGGDVDSSIVRVFDLEDESLVQETKGREHGGFGMAHSISTWGDYEGFVVGSLVPQCAPNMPCAMAPSMRNNTKHGGLYLYQLV